jgi:hypothetical protein
MQIFDTDMKRIVPKDIVMIDKNHIRIIFNENKDFYVFMKCITDVDTKYYGRYS